jgi:hypothetical protein
MDQIVTGRTPRIEEIAALMEAAFNAHDAAGRTPSDQRVGRRRNPTEDSRPDSPRRSERGYAAGSGQRRT